MGNNNKRNVDGVDEEGLAQLAQSMDDHDHAAIAAAHAQAEADAAQRQQDQAVVSQVSDLPALSHGESPFPSFTGPYTSAEDPEFGSAGGSPMQAGDVGLGGDDGGIGALHHARHMGHHQQRRSGSTGRIGVVLGEDGKPIPEAERPAQGTEEWNQMRRINHKEVERKRRETINDGINTLAALIQKEYTQPERNKGAILRKAASYIEKLKENETIHTERYTLDKLLSDQTIADLQSKVEKMKQECERAWREVDIWKRAAAEAGVKLDEVDVMASIDFPQ
jgi:bHLH factor